MVLIMLSDGSGRALPSADELAGTWMRSGPRRVQALTAALAQVGKPYRFAMRGPDAFDCSGLTSYAWGRAGVALRTSSFSQREQIERLERSRPALRVGDLVFYDRAGPRRGERVGHVSMALGWGDLIVEANAGADRVRVWRYDTGPLWGFGRVLLVEERTTVLLTRPRR
jgi:cell wall-associated NlpC family hydrolase